jgi:hypothetical protein
MVPANMAAFTYAEPHIFSFRSFSSFAAAIFIALVGIMINSVNQTNKYGWGHHLMRGTLLLVTATVLDMLVWKLLPSYGVLYILGVSCPLMHFFPASTENGSSLL